MWQFCVASKDQSGFQAAGWRSVESSGLARVRARHGKRGRFEVNVVLVWCGRAASEGAASPWLAGSLAARRQRFSIFTLLRRLPVDDGCLIAVPGLVEAGGGGDGDDAGGDAW